MPAAETPRSVSLPLALVAAVLLGGLGAGAGYYLANPPAPQAEGLAAGSVARERVVLAIQPTDNPDAIQARATELERFLEARSGLDVDIVIPLTYTGVVEALRFGHAQAAMMGAWPARLAHEVAGAEVVLAERREVIIDGQPATATHYFSYYVVPRDSPHHTLADLRGGTVAYPSLTSTSGYVYPVAELVSQGLVPAAAGGKPADPKAFFGEVLIAGGYAQAWQALKAGQADVAVTAGDIPAALFGEVMAGTRIVHTQGPVPSHAVVFAKGFEGPAAEALRGAMLELRGPHQELMRKLVSGIFVEFVPRTTQEHTASLDDALAKVGLRHQDKLG